MSDYLQKEIEFNNLVMDWNKKINLVSRKKTDVYDLIDDSRIYLKYIDFSSFPKILDLGTGGGFPGIVIKIHHPEIRVTLVDSIMKKITAVCEITSKLGLKNIPAICIRAEGLSKNKAFYQSFDYVVARSVGKLKDLVKWSHELIKLKGKLITLKGGDVDEEIKYAKDMKWVKSVERKPGESKEILIVNF
jgi:16S rRNA (guanine527-N7)-methyltransferase